MEIVGIDRNLCRLRKAIREKGFCIVRRFISVTADLSDLKKQVMNEEDVVFQHVGADGVEGFNDNKRLQLCIPFDEQVGVLKEISEATASAMKSAFPKNNLNQSHASVLFSLKDCMEQDLHWDYDPDKETTEKSFGCIVFLEDDGKLLLSNDYKIFTPEFQKGDMIIFKGTQLHAGASYKKENIRVHFYFDCEPGMRNIGNETETFLGSIDTSLTPRKLVNTYRKTALAKKAAKKEIRKLKAMKMNQINKLRFAMRMNQNISE